MRSGKIMSPSEPEALGVQPNVYLISTGSPENSGASQKTETPPSSNGESMSRRDSDQSSQQEHQSGPGKSAATGARSVKLLSPAELDKFGKELHQETIANLNHNAVHGNKKVR